MTAQAITGFLVVAPIGLGWLLRGRDLGFLRLPLSVLGLVMLAGVFLVWHSFDFYAYWVVNPADPYSLRSDNLQGLGVFRYAPPVALLFAPLHLLPLEVAEVAWMALQVAALWYIGRGWALALIVYPPVWFDIQTGNINILLAAGIVAGYRHPEVWTFALLSKATPAVGLVWFAVRREWLALTRVAAATGLLVAVSLAVQGAGVWADWIGVMAASSGQFAPGALALPLIPRVAAAALLIGWGGLTDRRWTVPVGVTLAMPVLWPLALTPLVALLRSRRWSRRTA